MNISSAGSIFLFNTLTARKEKFSPIESGKVRMYTCGPTVYDHAHIGNLRAFLFEDQLRRWLEYRGLKVTQVMNLTDVDDRTINASKKKGIPLMEYTKPFIEDFFEDIHTLNIEKAEYYPRATENIPEMVALIKKLMEKGYAYKSDDGSIYFDISRFETYGELAKIEVQKLKIGARVKVDEYGKEEAQDFALWKAWDEGDGNVFWNTEIGKGRPGWHIECSAMSMKYLGETLDIHCGGVDNKFPHHENEIAQSEAATGKKFVRFWMHNEHLLVEGRKMSKRWGNYYTLKDLTSKGYDPKAIRYLMMSTHYRQQLNFTFKALDASKSALDRLTNFMERLLDSEGGKSEGKVEKPMKIARREFENAMDDDLNIGLALAHMFNFVREMNNVLDAKALSKEEAREIFSLMTSFDNVLGVIGETRRRAILPSKAEDLVKRREDARRLQDWKAADEIRAQLEGMGVIIEDTEQGTKWHWKHS